MEYVKHLIDCTCIHPAFADLEEEVSHRFVVFSTIENDGKFIEHFSQCDNCGVIHRVTEVAQSTIIPKESMSCIPTIEEIEMELPDKLCNMLKKHNCPLHVWQEAAFIIENERWGEFIVLTREDTGYGGKAGKILRINEANKYKIESFEDTMVVEF